MRKHDGIARSLLTQILLNDERHRLGKTAFYSKQTAFVFFVLSSLSSLSAKVTFAELYRDKNNDYYFSPKKR